MILRQGRSLLRGGFLTLLLVVCGSAAQAEMAPPVAAAGLSEVVVTVSAEALLGASR